LSCAPETLARDLELLHQRGYRTRDITPLDMLPHTPHLEALAILDRQT
jgi:23S rRNA (uracil1939-C5)-methyltransferase